ncbi:hypothetical protein ANOM_009545 [Aspergillus nomiae NRRL 13137]|uniref:DUF7703 domain-containing protein n=1 Tax=Aspergillus nomiae NRRL (strain ATCC 15546 / NRRL 13137 / CBS 260.88 / M93) TaxID=1509407 RepID=A0A0L1IVH7_ASPN3|nr:uncharacterized protein ANOM_009545 [Aspergillus nomiae NRRL 13137]KNG83566.1 hypothetical protein ANOM_009545 [Aspergillus nomiae NRRL 13137]
MSHTEPSTIFGSGPGHGALGISFVVFISIALYNALELTVIIPLSFHRYNTLYFWALMTSAVLGVIPSTIGPALQFFDLIPLWLSMLLSNVGFWMMVPNQSVVLYSRLHLVSQNKLVLAFVRWLIIWSFFTIAVPTTVLNVGSSYVPQSVGWVDGFEAMERIQVTWFAVQETCISVIYIWYTMCMIRLSPDEDKRRHKILYELVIINIMAIVMDIALVILEYLGFYFTQIILKATIYSIKLKLEFAVLSMLVSIVQPPRSDPPTWGTNCTMSTFT